MMKRLYVILMVSSISHAAIANDFIDATHMVDLVQGSVLSDKAYGLQSGHYETSGGELITFNKWYSNKWTDVHVTFMTRVLPTTGVTWGFSTGEYGQKYNIDPSVKIGFVSIHTVTKALSVTVTGSYTLFGKFRERTCNADYGEVGGAQTVNCRLAASELPPSETLQYVLNERPYNYKTVSVQINYIF